MRLKRVSANRAIVESLGHYGQCLVVELRLACRQPLSVWARTKFNLAIDAAYLTKISRLYTRILSSNYNRYDVSRVISCNSARFMTRFTTTRPNMIRTSFMPETAATVRGSQLTPSNNYRLLSGSFRHQTHYVKQNVLGISKANVLYKQSLDAFRKLKHFICFSFLHVLEFSDEPLSCLACSTD